MINNLATQKQIEKITNDIDTLNSTLNEIKDNPKSLFKSVSISGNTNEYGLITLTGLEDKVVVFAMCGIGGTICQLGTSNTTRWVKVTNYDGIPKANTNLTVYAYYL